MSLGITHQCTETHPEISLGFEDRDPGSVLRFLFKCDGGLDFLIFELDQWVGRVATTVVLGQHSNGLLISTFVN
jgi:hypothetical protein